MGIEHDRIVNSYSSVKMSTKEMVCSICGQDHVEQIVRALTSGHAAYTRKLLEKRTLIPEFQRD